MGHKKINALYMTALFEDYIFEYIKSNKIYTQRNWKCSMSHTLFNFLYIYPPADYISSYIHVKLLAKHNVIIIVSCVAVFLAEYQIKAPESLITGPAIAL